MIDPLAPQPASASPTPSAPAPGDGRSRTVSMRRLLPNILTTLSLCSGLASLHFALQADWDRALSAIAVAAVFDVLDGGAARLLKATSRFGAVLDSLSDFLSFGVAPAVILHQWILKEAQAPGLAATMTFVLCSALRLARFTSSTSAPPTTSPLSRFFTGVPTPAAAGIVLIPLMLDVARTFQFQLPTWFVIFHVLLVAWLMVSRQPCFSLKRLRVPRPMVVPMLIAIGLLVVGAAKDLWLTAAVVSFGYLASVPVSTAVYTRLKKREDRAAGTAPALTHDATLTDPAKSAR